MEKESYLLELSRYIVLNPVRARMVSSVEDWGWSSFPAMAGLVPAPDWLEVDWLLGQFGTTRTPAQTAYRQFVQEGLDAKSPRRLERTDLARTRGVPRQIAEPARG